VIASGDVKQRSLIARSAAFVCALAMMQVAAPGCSVGDGSGSVTGTLDIPECWSGKFDLGPNFFGAVPDGNALTIRVQNGDDYTVFSDGLIVLVDNVHEIRGDAPYSPSLLNRALKVSIPAGVTAPGEPVAPPVDPGLVHMTLYLQHSCPTQNVALSVLSSVSVAADGTCNPASTGPFVLQCNSPAGAGLSALLDAGADATSDAAALPTEAGTPLPVSPPVRHSSITFASLFDANADEADANQRLTQATFDVYLADPRDACPGGSGPPPPCRGHLTGSFKFYFERGRPSQPFP
jgi:hypothetical protein